MRRVIVEMTMSLDGFVAPARGAEGHPAAPEAPALKQVKLDWLREAGTHLMGRVSYQEMAGHWPTSTDPYAARMNELPKVVFSQTLETAEWNDSRIARGDLSAEIAALKAEPGGDIIAWGGASFVQSLSRADLVDEYRLVINPVALGGGLPLFKDLPAPSSFASSRRRRMTRAPRCTSTARPRSESGCRVWERCVRRPSA
jgi:dihydrofolate reductase